ncbi:hypothetical protein ANN_10656 [Periplaneta americana]|uniref:Uncharacterized protein n=1 Tax=Periplaneta americana TaxID=6978 RepID=A0ABQ8T4J2_PERAM|nr:hypothetical protein ANN_10656 [Periplaneta americana]
MAGLCEGGNEPAGFLKAICKLFAEKSHNSRLSLCVKLRDAIEKKRRGKLRRKVLSYQDNAPSEKSLVVMAAVLTAGFELSKHPFYSPDLASSDFRLISKLKEYLRGKKFSTNNEVMQSLNQWFAEVGQLLFQEAVEMLEYLWEKCNNVLGNFVEKRDEIIIFNISGKNDAETDQKEEKELTGSLVEKKLPSGRNVRREKSSRQKKITDD